MISEEMQEVNKYWQARAEKAEKERDDWKCCYDNAWAEMIVARERTEKAEAERDGCKRLLDSVTCVFDKEPVVSELRASNADLSLRLEQMRERLASLVESASHVVHKNDCMCGWCCTMASDIMAAKNVLSTPPDELAREVREVLKEAWCYVYGHVADDIDALLRKLGGDKIANGRSWGSDMFGNRVCAKMGGKG